MKLLVVDDQGPVGAIISRIAQQGGWEAIHTTSFKDLAGTVNREKVDVVMVDYLVGDAPDGPTGLDAIEELRRKSAAVPVILFTGALHLVDRERAARLGVTRILEKPLSIQELRQSLNEASRTSAA
jgi:DNA-binding response OmpR family regulator